MTHYELRTPSGRPFCTFDQPDRARAFRAQHFAKAKVMLRLFEVKRDEREIGE